VGVPGVNQRNTPVYSSDSDQREINWNIGGRGFDVFRASPIL
jgi:hypothetical protein